MQLADVALPVPLAQHFSYAIPESMSVEAGARVVCPFGSRRVVGVVLGVREGEPPKGVRKLFAVVDDAIPAELLGFLRELSQYYLSPIGEVVRLALPPAHRGVEEQLEEPSLFGPDKKGKRGVSARRVQWVVPTAVASDARLGPAATAILTHLRAVGDAPLARLSEQWRGARSSVARLVEVGLVKLEEREVPDSPYFTDSVVSDKAPELTRAQIDSVAAIIAGLDGPGETFLLHGVTGSGKTEVYLHAVEHARKRERGVILIVPEIALTPQLVSRYRARFGDAVAVLHSALTPKERYVMWRKLRAGEVDVAIGARSAIFAPVRDLGLVLVDEEHDSSFKQEEGVRYHARDMAILRARRAGGTCVLGSATPSLESEQLVATGKAKKLVLPDRARSQALPKVQIVDLRRIGAGPTGDKRLSIPLHRAIEETLKAKEQTILFLNRRGFAPSVRCHSCGTLVSCPHCSVALTFHKRSGGSLRCHYCDFAMALPDVCGKCQVPGLALEGLGTEKLEEVLTKAFPEARIARLDRDVATGKAIEGVLTRVRAREVDILVGTQMVTKGHDLPHVTLVGVVNADAALSIPDFRAAERAFQLMVQVAGRAGRGDAPGRVIVQTHDPEHAALVFASRHDVQGFLARELIDRRELGYPPFSRIALVHVEGLDENEARAACSRIADIVRQAAKGIAGVEILGPAPAPLAKLRNRHRFRVMIRSRSRADLRRVLIPLLESLPKPTNTMRYLVDVDPVQLL